MYGQAVGVSLIRSFFLALLYTRQNTMQVHNTKHKKMGGESGE